MSRRMSTRPDTGAGIVAALNDRLKGRMTSDSAATPIKGGGLSAKQVLSRAMPSRKPAPTKRPKTMNEQEAKSSEFKSAQQLAKEAMELAKLEKKVREEWAKWILKIGASDAVIDALKLPVKLGEAAVFDYTRGLSRETVESVLGEAGLGGLADTLVSGLDGLRNQSAASGSHLNEKFQKTGKFTMRHGTIDVFFSGLESLLGPPLMIKDPEVDDTPTIRMSMENEHTNMSDSQIYFTSPNGTTSTSAIEWEFCYAPQPDHVYPERKDFREQHPNWCRKAVPIRELKDSLLEKEANSKLRNENMAEVILEEFLAGRMYTGPMYFKYNAVLRAETKDPFLVKSFQSACGPAPFNKYVSTIHAINSCVLKLSKLAQAGKVWRGTCYGLLPSEFWVEDKYGVLGGIEFGFQSTTRVRSQAIHYATGGGYAKPGDAMTLFEINMGMVDRGAELGWFSQ